MLGILALIGAIGYFYILERSASEVLHQGLNKSILLKYIILPFLFILLSCFAGSALIVLWGGPALYKLSVTISIIFTLIVIWRILFANFLHKRVGKYFIPSKNLVSSKEKNDT